MSISYEGIGEWCATFVCGAVSEGDIVKVSANGTVGKLIPQNFWRLLPLPLPEGLSLQ